MGNWKYFELIAKFYRALLSFVAQGETESRAADRALNDFWFVPEDEHVFSNFVILVQYMDIKLSFEPMITDSLVVKFNTHLSRIDRNQLNTYLNLEEIDHLKELMR